MQIVSIGDSFHEISNPVFWEKQKKYFKMSSAENFTKRAKNYIFRREIDSGSESDVSPKYTARQRQAKSGTNRFEREWQLAMQR